MGTASRSSNTQSQKSVVPVKTPTAQLDPSSTNFNDALQRFQSGVVDTLDAVLTWLNNHYQPAAPTKSKDGRTVTDDTTTLIGADGEVLTASGLVTIQFPSSLVPASTAHAVVYQLPLPANCYLDGWSTCYGGGTAGNAALTISSGTRSTLLTIGQGFKEVLITPALPLLQFVSVVASSDSSWSAVSGPVFVTLYVSQHTG